MLSKLSRIPAQMERGARGGVEAGIEAIEQDARHFVPVDTGALRDSISGEMTMGNRIEGKVTADKDYAAAVEFGSEGGRPQPFMSPAYNANRENIVQDIAQRIREEI